MPGGPPRWEFRIWHEGVRDLPAGPVEVRLDTYLLRPGLTGRMVKVREGHLEVKELLAREDGLECWRPEAGLPFPLETGDLSAALCLDAASRSQLGRRFDGLDDLLVRLERWTDVTGGAVEKRRVRVERDGCPGESVQVQACGAGQHTEAIEHEDAQVVARTRAVLGWGALANESYVTRLRRGDRLAQPARRPTMRWSA